MGKKAKNKKITKALQAKHGESEDTVHAPHSFVIQRGVVGKQVKELIQNMRRVMSPFTAENLKERNKNMLKDYIAVAGPLNVSHMLMFSKTDRSVNLRIARLPRGPTLTFQVKSYSTIRDLSQTVRKHDDNPNYFLHHPLLVMNNFKSDANHLKLTSSMFQNMFPSININEVRLKQIKRVALVNYDSDTDTVEFRHYHLRVVPVGVSKPVSKLLKAKVPTLSKYEDISQFLLNPGALSESEAELDGEQNEVELPQSMDGRGNMKNAQSAIRLREIGPRMTLSLVKISNGVCAGDVLYHKFIKKTEEEIKEQKAYLEEKQRLKTVRREQQKERVRLKEQEKAELKKKCSSKQPGTESNEDDSTEESPDKPDAEWYEEEVGEKPEADLFPKTMQSATKRKQPAFKSQILPPKKPRHTDSRGRSSDRNGGRSTDRKGGRPDKKSGRSTDRRGGKSTDKYDSGAPAKSFKGGARDRSNGKAGKPSQKNSNNRKSGFKGTAKGGKKKQRAR